jgi:hypothetical protein
MSCGSLPLLHLLGQESDPSDHIHEVYTIRQARKGKDSDFVSQPTGLAQKDQNGK